MADEPVGKQPSNGEFQPVELDLSPVFSFLWQLIWGVMSSPIIWVAVALVVATGVLNVIRKKFLH